jgi:hypothetical protein
MNVRRLLAGVLLAGLAVPTLGAAPHARVTPAAQNAAQRLPLGMGSRVFARAEAEPPAPPPSAEPSPAASGPAASVPSPEIAARARAAFEANRAGKIDRSAYSADMSSKITDAGLARVAAELRSLGEVKTFVQVRKITMGTLVAYVFRIEAEKPPIVEETISWDAAGKIDVLQFGPAR